MESIFENSKDRFCSLSQQFYPLKTSCSYQMNPIFLYNIALSAQLPYLAGHSLNREVSKSN